jgi:hypothetical protein
MDAANKKGDVRMIRTIHGVIHGKTIQLDEDLGVAEGQAVEVQVRIIPAAGPQGGGLSRSAGALADDPHWDGIMAEIYEDRKRDARREVPE